MIDALRHLLLEAEAGGFQAELCCPAERPPYLIFELVGDTTPRGLAAAIELRETFCERPDRADALFIELMSTGAVLHPVTDAQKLSSVEEPVEGEITPTVGTEIIFLHDGPDGWAVLTKVEKIIGNNIVIDVPAGQYRFPVSTRAQQAVEMPATEHAHHLDTWLIPATTLNRAVYLTRDGAQGGDVETLIRHSPPNGRAMQ